MTQLFGKGVTRKELATLCPDITRLTGVRQFREENGAGSGQRVIRIESGGGLSVELLPDRTCDIGQVWCDGVPFGWIGPIGTSDPSRLRGNQPLSGLLSTCGFDHIRKAEDGEGGDYPQHGSMMHQPASILEAGPVWRDDECAFKVRAECTLFSLDRGGMRLRRDVEVPLGGRQLFITDEVELLVKPQPLMAMYHINFGYPVAGQESRLSLNGTDITADCLGMDGIRTRPSGDGNTHVRLSNPTNGAVFDLHFDGDQLPVLQTLQNSFPGINLICIEPATHERQSRDALRRANALEVSPVGAVRQFKVEMAFGSGQLS